MTDYKLVPVEPTEGMIDAARDQHEGEPYLPVSLYKAMLAAAPDVQGEPVGEAGSLPGTSGFTTAVFESRKVPVGTELYATPQPLVGRTVALRYPENSNTQGWIRGAVVGVSAESGDILCEIGSSLTIGVLPAEQQPDITQLVEALEEARETIAYALRANAPDYFTTDADIARHVVIQRIDTALAAYRKGAQP